MKMSRNTLIAIGAILFVLVGGYYTLAGRPVNSTFSSVNSGLATGGNLSYGAQYPMPQAAAAATSAPAATAAPASAAPAGSTSARETALDSSASAAGGAALKQAAQPLDRLVVKTAQVSLQVEDVAKAEAAVRAKVAALNGYIVKVETNGADKDMTASIIFRVPSAGFDNALAGVEVLAKKVLGRTLGGEDMTEEFVDLTSRLKNLEATRDRLVTFLDKASKVNDALEVNTALTDVQGQIEQIQGRMKFLQQSAAMSTITVALQPVPPVPPLVEEDGWQPTLVARNALRGLLGFGQGIANFIIVLAIWSPVWVPLLLLGWWLVRRSRGETRPRTT